MSNAEVVRAWKDPEYRGMLTESSGPSNWFHRAGRSLLERGNRSQQGLCVQKGRAYDRVLPH